MYVLVAYMNEEDQMKNERARVVKTLYSYILDTRGQLTPRFFLLSSLPAGTKTSQSKMKAPECFQNYTVIGQLTQ